MTTLTMPTTPGIKASRFLLQSNTRLFTSPLTGTVQSLDLLGARWLATYTLPPMTPTQAGPWCAFLVRLRGMAGRFYGYDPAATTARGTATGTPRVNGSSQVGRSIQTDGWTAGVTTILKTGDYIAWDTPSGWRELHKVTANVASDGAGNATIPIRPHIRESPADNATIIVSSASCIMRLATDSEARWLVDEAKMYTITFSAEETFAPSEV